MHHANAMDFLVPDTERVAVVDSSTWHSEDDRNRTKIQRVDNHMGPMTDPFTVLLKMFGAPWIPSTKTPFMLAYIPSGKLT